MTLADRIYARLVLAPNGTCWHFDGAHAKNGRALVRVKRSDGWHVAFVYREAWMLANGCPIPAGLVLDHVCADHGCWNPDHLEPVTQAENNLRAWRVGRQRAGREAARRARDIKRMDKEFVAIAA